MLSELQSCIGLRSLYPESDQPLHKKPDCRECSLRRLVSAGPSKGKPADLIAQKEAGSREKNASLPSDTRASLIFGVAADYYSGFIAHIQSCDQAASADNLY